MKTNARIYVMRADDGTLKLGHSRDPNKRSKHLGRPVTIVHTTDVVEEAERIERLAHRVLAIRGRHIGGEWFVASLDDAIAAIETATRQAEGLELALGSELQHWTKQRPSKAPILVKLPPKVLERIDAYCKAQAAPPTRTAVIEAAIGEFLDAHTKVRK